MDGWRKSMAMDKDPTKKAADSAGDANPGQDAMKAEVYSDEREEKDVDAEDTIRYFIRDRLNEFHEEMETALDLFEAHFQGMDDNMKTAVNQRGFFDHMGDKFIAELVEAAGGKGLPIADALGREADQAVSFAEHSCFELPRFIDNAFRRGTRDACWFVRDSSTSILSQQWSSLLKLAANGSNQFIHGLYKLGLPSRSFKPDKFAHSLKKHAKAYERSLGLQKEEVEDKQVDTGKKAELEEQAQKDMVQEEKKNAAQM